MKKALSFVFAVLCCPILADELLSCTEWGSEGYCESKHDMMLLKCRRTCEAISLSKVINSRVANFVRQN